MISRKFIFFFIVVFTSCTSISKMYRAGNTANPTFTSEVEYSTVFDLIIVPVTIEGKEYRFLFDTGAPMVLSKEISEELQLKPVAKGRVRDSQGKSNSLNYVWIETIQIGDVSFNKLGAIVADLKLAPEINCMKIDGVIGANLMKLAVWKIDSESQKLTFSTNRDSLGVPRVEPISIPFQIKSSYTPVIDITINDSVEVKRATFDTGYGGYLSLNGDVIPEDIQILRKLIGYGSTGLYGSSFDTIYNVKADVKLGGFVQSGLVNFTIGKNKSLLGMDYLSQFDVVLDWNQQKIDLYPKNISEFKDLKSFGVSPKWMEGKLVVGTLEVNSKAQKSGIKVGDEIVELNGWSFHEPALETYCEMMIALHTEKPDSLIIKFKNGNEFRVSGKN